MSEKKTCGECKWFMADNEPWRVPHTDPPIIKLMGKCLAPVPDSADEDEDATVESECSRTCPAFDDCSFVKAVDELVKAVQAYVDWPREAENNLPSEHYVRELRTRHQAMLDALAAVREAREGRGK